MFRWKKGHTLPKCGPRKADSFLKLNTFIGQRPISEFWIKFLHRKYEAGLYTEGRVVLANYNGHQILVDGQHTNEFLTRYGVTVPVHVTEYDCDENEDVVRLYSQLNKERKRNFRDTIRVYRELYLKDREPDLYEIPMGVLARAGKSVRIAKEYPRILFVRSVQDEEMLEAIDNDKKSVLFLSRYGKAKSCRRLGVGVAQAVTFSLWSDGAQGFWDRTVEGENLTRNMPEHRLMRVLHEQAALTGYSGGYGPAANRFWYVHCITWWNSFVLKDNRQKFRYYSEGDLPLAKGKKDIKGK